MNRYGGGKILKKKQSKKFHMQTFCDFHNTLYALYVCASCGKSICYLCQKNYTQPYICPDCIQSYWIENKKQDKKRNGLMILTIIIIIVPLLSFIYLINLDNDYYADYGCDYEYDYENIYLYEKDIIPIIKSQDIDSSERTEVDLSLKVFLTNSGDKDSSNTRIELYAMKNNTVHFTSVSESGIVQKDFTKPFFVNITLPPGDYDLRFYVWEKANIMTRETISINIPKDSNENISTIDCYW